MDIQKIRTERLNEIISSSGYSYAELEKLTGFSKSSIQRYATGETKKIPIDCLEKIATVTKSDVRYLMGWEDNAETNTKINNNDTQSLSSRQHRIVELFDELTIPQQDNIIGRAEMLVEQNENGYKEEEIG